VDFLVYIDKGEIVARGPPEELRNQGKLPQSTRNSPQPSRLASATGNDAESSALAAQPCAVEASSGESKPAMPQPRKLVEDEIRATVCLSSAGRLKVI
jgi:hypothetical protein